MDEATPLSRFHWWQYLDNAILRRLRHRVQPCYLCAQGTTPNIGLCPACVVDLARRDPLAAPGLAHHGRAVDGWLVPFEYRFPLERIIRRAKFQRDIAALNCCKLLLEREVSKHLRWVETRFEPLPAQLLPVPLSAWRFLRRGFNQSAALAAGVAHIAKGQRIDDSVSRRGHQAPQSRLDAGQRGANVRGRFRVHDRLDGRHVIIVDDVVTTGATVGELARTLRRAGAARVSVVALAATP